MEKPVEKPASESPESPRIQAAEDRLKSAFEKAFYIVRNARDEAFRIGIPEAKIDELYKNASGEGE